LFKNQGFNNIFPTLSPQSQFKWSDVIYSVYLLLMSLCNNMFEWVKEQVARKTGLMKSTAIKPKAFLIRWAAVPEKRVKNGRQLYLALSSKRDYSGMLKPCFMNLRRPHIRDKWVR
jgi:hypothetical protein